MSRPNAKRAKVHLTVSEEKFRELGSETMRRDPEGRSQAIFMRRWVPFFGVEPVACVDAWACLKVAVNDPDDPELSEAKPEHLLWAMLFLKKCGAEEEMASITGAHDKKCSANGAKSLLPMCPVWRLSW
jgi:hypothetical protein